ncbi:glycosyltransferase family 4 protein [candidate division KSB1 bacterium]|nr:glycosyltransferase family 4 protein [candidate division KSB1 bacterium]
MKEILLNLDPAMFNIEKVIIWSNKSTINHIPDLKWIKSIDVSKTINSWVGLLKWNFKILYNELLTERCDVLFVPGGTYLGKFHPYVTMAQNLLPFDKIERKKYRYSKSYFRYVLLELTQKYTFKKADGVIFLTNYSHKKIINESIGPIGGVVKTIYHGVDESFFNTSRQQKDIFKKSNVPTKLLYVSIINYYKKQINVVKAFEILIKKGYDIELELVGPAFSPALVELKNYISKMNGLKNKIRYVGNVENKELQKYYNNSDIFIFASSSETFGMILLEAMASGLPIACSNVSSMPEILEQNGEYFDPNDPISISQAIEELLINKKKRIYYSNSVIKRAKQFTWEKCSNKTFQFVTTISKNTKG